MFPQADKDNDIQDTSEASPSGAVITIFKRNNPKHWEWCLRGPQCMKNYIFFMYSKKLMILDDSEWSVGGIFEKMEEKKEVEEEVRKIKLNF